MAVDDRRCPHSLVHFGAISVDFIVWSLCFTILIELRLGLLSGDHAFAHSFNEVVSLGIVIMRSWWKVGCPKGKDQFGIDLCRGHGFLYLRPTGGAGGRVMPPLPFGLGAYQSLVVRSNSCRAWYARLSMHEFSHSNAWAAFTDVPPKELRWPLCTGWTLGWCRMLPTPVSIQSYECKLMVTLLTDTYACHQWLLLLTCFNFNPSMDK